MAGRPQNRGHNQKPRQPQLKHDCGCGMFIYLPWKQTRLASEAGGHRCGACGGTFIPANIEDCAEFAPALLHLHGDYVEPSITMDAPQWGYKGSGGYCECTYQRPQGADPDYWVCPKCRKVNERYEDGSMGSFTAGPFSPEVEKAHGLATKVRRDREVRTLPEPDTYQTVPDDLPF